MDIYRQIKTRENYDKLLYSGVFWEFHPELTGVWSEDRLLINAKEPKKYDVIYTDPPWDVKKIKRKSRPNQVEMDYPTMKLEEICKLPVSGMTKDNAVLFLWTTHADRKSTRLNSSHGYISYAVFCLKKKKKIRNNNNNNKRNTQRTTCVST